MNKEIKKTNGYYADFFRTNKKDIRELKYNIGDTELLIHVYPTIPFIDRTKMVNEIFRGVFFVDAESQESFVPEYLNFLKMYYTIKNFTDFELPDNLEEAWAIISTTSLFQDVYNILGRTLDMIFDEADQKIDCKKTYISNKTDFNMLLSKLTAKIDSINTDFSKKDMGKIMDVLSNLGNVQPDDIVNSVLKTQGSVRKKTSGK